MKIVKIISIVFLIGLMILGIMGLPSVIAAHTNDTLPNAIIPFVAFEGLLAIAIMEIRDSIGRRIRLIPGHNDGFTLRPWKIFPNCSRIVMKDGRSYVFEIGGSSAFLTNDCIQFTAPNGKRITEDVNDCTLFDLMGNKINVWK